MAASADIWNERDAWGGSLGWSIALHAALFGSILAYGAILGNRHGAAWGGGGGDGSAMSATLVNSIPLPSKPQANNVLATDSKGLTQSLPHVEEKAPDAISIPERDAKRKPWEKAPRSTTQQKPKPVEQATNVVPFGQGGPVSGPYAAFTAGAARGGLAFNGGGGDFGSRYSWYVAVVNRRIAENWLKYEIDPNISGARRVYVTFDILRGGQPANVQVEQSGGVPSLDVSAVNAVKRIDSFGPLPPDYSGSKVSVEFWFDYKR
ncbi:MAG: TonB family protein [Terriglobales bacterium]|jgi:protein TonB